MSLSDSLDNLWLSKQATIIEHVLLLERANVFTLPSWLIHCVLFVLYKWNSFHLHGLPYIYRVQQQVLTVILNQLQMFINETQGFSYAYNKTTHLYLDWLHLWVFFWTVWNQCMSEWMVSVKQGQHSEQAKHNKLHFQICGSFLRGLCKWDSLWIFESLPCVYPCIWLYFWSLGVSIWKDC